MARIFVELQDKRHIADYDNGNAWTLTETLSTIRGADRAFALWKVIRERISQDFLVSLLIRPRD